MKVLKDVFRVAFSNIVGFGTSFLINFMLPAILTVADYGHYQQYILYISFTYLFNLGFNDGIYIKYGGKDEEDLDSEEVQQEHNFLLAFQLLMFAGMMGVAIWQQNMIFALFSVATLFDTINTYHANFLQATGRFKVFSSGNILKSIFNIFILLAAIFIFQTSNYYVYIIINILAYFFLTIYFEWHYIQQHGWSKTFDPKGKLKIFQVGFLILASNMSLTFVGNIGRWVANTRYAIEEYAQYAFQNSLLNVILLIVNAVGMVFYNVISRRSDQDLLNTIKKACVFSGIASGLAFFIFKQIILIFFEAYIPSINLLSITFIAIPYIMLSKILIGNLYKTQTSENIYFRDSILYLAFSVVLVVGTDAVFNNLQMVAIATTLCYILWFIYATTFKFDYLRNSFKEILLLVTHTIIFYLTANVMGTWTGFSVYLIYLIIVLLFSRQDIKDMIQMLK